MKKTLLTGGASVTALGAFAQGTADAGNSLWSDPYLPFYLTAAAVGILLILVIIVAIYVIRVLNFLTQEAARQGVVAAKTVEARPLSWWKRFLQKVNASVPVEREKEIELDHNYDGIRELDNHLPPWWKWLFNGSIAFAVLYIILYHVTGTLPLAQEEYDRELAQAEQQIREYQASQPKAVIDESTLEYTADAELIENGRKVFLANTCAGCHREDGGGNAIGPNLTDDYWLHGGDVREVFQTIKNGVVEKGMPAWGKSMSPRDVRDVTFFVMSLHGSNPPDAKAPQGELVKQKTTTKSDTVKAQAGL